MDNIKNNLANIRDGFSILDGQDKLVYLIDLGKKLDHINESDRTENRKIHACTSQTCLLYTSPSPRDRTRSRMPSSA